jgi:hypothetical protein
MILTEDRRRSQVPVMIPSVAEQWLLSPGIRFILVATKASAAKAEWLRFANRLPFIISWPLWIGQQIRIRNVVTFFNS